MIQTFQDFQKENKYTDIVIKLSDRDIPAHQVVLAASSPYFDAVLRNTLEQGNSGIIETDLANLDQGAVSDLMDYMYHKDFSVPDKALLPRMYACDLPAPRRSSCKMYKICRNWCSC